MEIVPWAQREPSEALIDLAFEWQIVSVSTTGIQIKLEFETPLKVKAADKLMISTQFVDFEPGMAVSKQVPMVKQLPKDGGNIAAAAAATQAATLGAVLGTTIL